MAAATIAPAQPKTPKSLKAGEGRRGLLLVAPTLVMLALVIIYPLVRAVLLSFQKDQQLVGGFFQQGGAAGLGNYRHWLLQQCQTSTGWSACPPGNIGSQFWGSFGVTVFWTVVSVGIEVVLGLWFATIMNREFRGRGLVRAAILVPWAIPTAVTAKLWYFIYAYDGILNHILGFFGIAPQLWTSDTWPARMGVVIADVWKTTPFMALLILAGLQMLPREVYEAARVDGIGSIRLFVRVTLPLLRPALLVAVIFRALDALRVFDLIYVLTANAAGTRSMSSYARQQLVDFQDVGYGSAASTLVFLVIALLTVVYITAAGVRFGAETAR